jgi:hypothetical protein
MKERVCVCVCVDGVSESRRPVGGGLCGMMVWTLERASSRCSSAVLALPFALRACQPIPPLTPFDRAGFTTTKSTAAIDRSRFFF